MTHVNIFTQIFKAGLARARHTPAESFLDTSYENVFLFQVSKNSNVTRTTKITRVPPARALFHNGSVLIFGLPTKNNACAIKTGLTTENRSD